MGHSDDKVDRIKANKMVWIEEKWPNKSKNVHNQIENGNTQTLGGGAPFLIYQHVQN